MNKKLLTKSSYGSSKHALTALVAGALATSLLTAPAVAAENSASTPQPDPNQTMQEVDKTEAGYAAALQNLPETVKNNTFADNAFTAAADKLNLKPGAIKEVNELGGWRAIDGGTFAVAKARKDGLYLNSMLGSSTTNVQEHPNTADQWNPEVQYFVNEQATGKAPYVLAIGRGWDYFSQQTGAQKINGKNFVQPFHGIERSFKAYSKEYGSQVVVDFNTGSLAQTSRAAGYTVRVLATKDGKESEIYTASFDPGKQDATAKYTVTPFGEGKGTPTFNYNEASKEEIADGTAIPYTRSKTGGTVQYASQATFKKPANLDGIESGAQGRFTSRPITLEKGVTDYKVQITSDFDNDNGVYESWGSDSSLKLQRSVKHYVNPLFNGFYVDQKTDLTAKELLKAQLAALKAKRDEYVKGKSDPSIAKLDEAIKAAEDAVNAQDVKKLSEYKELGKKLTESKDQLIDITDALNAVQKELDNKLAEIKDAPGALDADKAEAKKAAEAAAEKAKAAIKAVAAKEDLPKVRDEGVNSIKAVTVSNKEALAAKVNDDPAFQKTPGYINAKEQSFQNSDGTPNAEKNQKASKHLSDYEAALQKAKDVLAKPTATQDEVNKALDELNKARAPFASEDATDLAPLKDSLNKNGQVEKTAPIYVNATGEEQQAYDQAMKAAEDLLKDPNATQSQVNAAKKALDDAKAALDKRATDKTKLSAAVTASVDNNDGKTSVFYKNAKNPNYKVPAGTDPQAAKGFADAYDKALENAKKVLADPQATQKQVDEATAALKKAEADLQKLSSDPKDLIEEVNNQITVQGLPAFANLKEKAQKDGADSQAAKDLAAYEDAVTKAGAALLKYQNAATDPANQPTQQELDEAKAALQAARDLVDKYATDTRKLQNALDNEKATKAGPAYANAAAPAYVDKDGKPDAEKNKQAKDAKDAYDKAVADGKKVLANPQATQAEVDAAEKAIADAEAGLAPFATDASQLAKKVGEASAFEQTPAYANAVASKNGMGENADVAAYKKALEAAKAVLADPKATQADVDKALKDLKDAEDKITKEYPTDSSKLEAEAKTAADIQKGDEFKDALGNEHTKDAAKAYQNALVAAKAVLGNKNATQADVDKALKDLKAAGDTYKDALAKKADDANAGKDDTEGKSEGEGNGEGTSQPGGNGKSETRHTVKTEQNTNAKLPATGTSALFLLATGALVTAGGVALRLSRKAASRN